MKDDDWMRWNPLTRTYDTKDGTQVAGELVDSCQSLAQLLVVCTIREEQRKAIAVAQKKL